MSEIFEKVKGRPNNEHKMTTPTAFTEYSRARQDFLKSPRPPVDDELRIWLYEIKI